MLLLRDRELKTPFDMGFIKKLSFKFIFSYSKSEENQRRETTINHSRVENFAPIFEQTV